MVTKPLTAQQENVLRFVQGFQDEHGFAPSLREIGAAIGLMNVNAVRGHLAALEKKGYINRSPDKARSIQVVPKPSALSRAKRKLHEVFRTDEGVYHRVVYGIAWTTRGKAPLLVGPKVEQLSAALDREAIEHGWTLLEKRIEPNHVVAIVETWPNHSPEKTVRRLQSAAKVLKNHNHDPSAAEFGWDKGYVITTDLTILEDLIGKMLANGGGQANGA